MIVDSLVMSLVMQGKMENEDFEREEDGAVYVSKSAGKRFIKEYEKKLRVQVNYFKDEGAMSFRRAIQYQANCLVKAIEEGCADRYKPIWIR